MNWLCWHVGTVTDPKLRRIADECRTPFANVIAIWVMILESAKDRRGQFKIDTGDAAYWIGAHEGDVCNILKQLEARGLILGDAVVKWKERQHATSAARMAEKRAKENEQSENVTHSDAQPVTVRNVTPTVQDSTVQNIDTEINSEVESSTIPASRKREPALELPRDWVADDIDNAFARRMSLSEAEIVREQTKFAAYWSDGKGRGTRRTPKGWRSTWQNWISKATERGLGNGSEHRNSGGNGFAELIRTGAIEEIARGRGGFDEAA